MCIMFLFIHKSKRHMKCLDINLALYLSLVAEIQHVSEKGELDLNALLIYRNG